jgi:signal transduction histidine kinase
MMRNFNLKKSLNSSIWNCLNVWLSFLCLIIVFPVAAQAGEQYVIEPSSLTVAQFLMSELEQPPHDGNWQTISLPDSWPQSRYTLGNNGWYRFNITLDKLPQQDWGIYLPHLNMNAAVYLNGEFLGDGGRFTEPMARNWNRPLYFRAALGSWKVGDNALYIRIKSYPGYGQLVPPLIGSEEILQPRHSLHVFFQNDINTILMIGTLFAGVFILAIWFSRRSDTMYFWYALMALIWALFTSNTIIRQIPVSAKIWDWIIYSCIAWWTVLLAIFSHRAAGIKRPRLEAAFTGWATLSTIAYGLTDLKFISQTTFIWQIGSIVIGFVVVWELLTDDRHDRRIRLLGLLIALVLLTGIHDWLLQSGIISRWWHYGNHLLHYSAPLLIMYIGWTLVGRFIRALNESEQLNVTLEQRFATAQEALQKNFAERRQMEVNQAAMIERERIFRDLHDDVGAKLLGLAISAQRANLTREADVARSALQDLRDVVSRSSHSIILLEDLLADLRAETEQRLNATGLKLLWSFPHDETTLNVSAEIALNLSRILRESITNVLRHADAQKIIVTIHIEPASLIFEIADDGKGFSIESIKQHRGMTSMNARASVLNADLQWHHMIPHGCRVKLSVPLSIFSPPLNAGVTTQGNELSFQHENSSHS